MDPLERDPQIDESVERREFQRALKKIFDNARESKLSHVDVSAGELHRIVGDYPGPNHRMPTCCNVMRHAYRYGDTVLKEPPSGTGASLTIRYVL